MRRLWVFLGVAFGWSWALALALAVVEAQLGHRAPLVRTGLLTLFMGGPALGALAAQRLAPRCPVSELGIRLSPNRWWLVAWLSPILLALITGLVSLTMPGVEPSFDFAGMLERLAPQLSAEQLEKASAQLHAIPPSALVAVMLVQALIAGVSINMVAAFGEELGWRGFLAQTSDVTPVPAGFWTRSLVVGAVWGVWHAPIILQGHNYPEHPVVGVFMMIAWTTLLAPSFLFIRERGGSVWASSILHGTLNASAGFAVLFLKGGSDLMVGVTGLAGFIVLVVVNAAIAVALRGSANRP